MGKGGSEARPGAQYVVPMSFSSVRRVQSLGAHQGKIVALAWSPSGSFLASSAQDALVKLWAVVIKGRYGVLQTAPLRTLSGHTADVLDMAWSKGDFLVTAAMDRSVRLWHPQTEFCLRRFLHPDMVAAVAFHPTDDNCFVTGGCDGTTRIWRPKEHACVAHSDVGSVITSAHFAPDGRTVLVGTYDGDLIEYDVQAVLEQTSHTQHVATDDAFPRRNNSRLEFTTVSSTVAIKRRRRLAPSRRRVPPSATKVCAIASVPESDEVLVTGGDARVHVLRASNSEQVLSKFRAQHPKKGTNLTPRLNASLSADGRYMVADADGGDLHVIDFGYTRSTASVHRRRQRETVISLQSLTTIEKGNVSAASFAPQATVAVAMGTKRSHGAMLLAVGAEDGTLCIMTNVPKPVP